MSTTPAAEGRSPERQEFLWGIFVTALEGGISYWANIQRYRWSTGDGNTPDHEGFHATVTEDEGRARHVIDPDVIERGVQAIAGADNEACRELHLHPSYAATVREANFQNDAGRIDAELADIIVQVGLLGDVVYG